ncbi:MULTISPECIES: hypothetical protein [Alphaproteobacteria]|uniref:Uncharacterized protein n=2 Tax=Alphaproteobacteria TaxID=28211 RepID=A0A512HMR7_9HYPH|nr:MULTISPECIES: hypothetical protein [Alphaproteobacteria]GEO86745.1 hypothetical protein RNA01_36770 [Ciceribacter naphthalenivorans]GLR20796.1 hypothetical protein GCM10007920_05800 [Ciceribacter naphthalenivorans]GLT03652.1 hypothetical protein GCM10007926_05800 [Sphingomonas psychrolutea]
MPWVDPTSYTSFDAKVRHAQAAERGKLQFLFLTDGPSHVGDIDNEGTTLRDHLGAPPQYGVDPRVTG